MTYTETDLVQRIERLAEADLAALSQEQRDQFDQFHAGGTEAVDRLGSSLRLVPTMTVLDVGSGLGGPARQIARTVGCTVVGVDITPAYVGAARALTRAAEIHDRVTFVCSDVAALRRDDFDAGYTMHVQMNVADKHTFFSEIARRLRPGARFAIFEVCRTGDTLPRWPQPWSLDGSDSHLVTAEELRRTVEACGFETLAWHDETTVTREWFEDVAQRMAAVRGAATLPEVLNDGPTRMLNFAGALAEGVVSIQRGSFVRAPSRSSRADGRSRLAALARVEHVHEHKRFDDEAATWDDDPAHEKRQVAVAEAIKAAVSLGPSMSAVDIGGGTGRLSILLADLVGSVVVTDPSAGMVRVARERIEAAGLGDRLRAIQADLTVDPLDGVYDLAWSSMALHHVRDLDGLLRSVAGLLVDGGRLCIADLDTDRDGAFHAGVVDFDGHHGFDRERLAEQLIRAGFADVEFTDATTILKNDREFGVFLCTATRVRERNGD